MRKRPCPWSEGHAPQIKCHVSEKDITKRSSSAMEAVYNKTLAKLFNGAKNASNNNLLEQPRSVVEHPDQILEYQQQGQTSTEKETTHDDSPIEIDRIFLPSAKLRSPPTTPNSTQRVPLIFHAPFSNTQKETQAAPVCVSCVRFSSTAAALNPLIVASSQPCSSCFGSTCQLCLNPCRGCSTLVCGNCSIDVESVSGHKAEMFIVCLGCRDRFDTDSSGCTMDTA